MENTHTAICARVCVGTWTSISFYSGGGQGSEWWVNLSRVAGLVQGLQLRCRGALHAGSLRPLREELTEPWKQERGCKEDAAARRTLKTRHSLDPHLSPLPVDPRASEAISTKQIMGRTPGAAASRGIQKHLCADRRVPEWASRGRDLQWKSFQPETAPWRPLQVWRASR